ncbi:MAG: penicillin-binding protein 2 [Candidatus Cloacimonetes bacterium 4572_55]|nr:MAG: penicillin-binding protein 2 [Candidatus Cloacimonetes bacterium 4572_55]
MDFNIDKKNQQKKAWWLKGILYFLFLSILCYCFYLQILKGDRFEKLANGNRIRIVRNKPLRGTVYDRNGTILADNKPAFTISVTYADIRKEESEQKLEIDLLLELLDFDPDALSEKIANAKKAPFDPYPLIRNAPIEQVSLIEERSFDLPGVLTKSDPIRNYPLGELTAHFLGYMGEISPTRYERFKKERKKTDPLSYWIGDQIGKIGLEMSYEQELRGENGFAYREVDVWGRNINDSPQKQEIIPKAGNDLYLTVDIALQDTLSKLLHHASATSGGGAAAVAINPRTGGILAFCSAPSFDANLFTSGISQKEWDALNNDPNRPLFNRAFQGTYPPGSTFKLLIALIGLEQEYITPDGTLPRSCGGGMQIGNRYFRCWKASGHGWTNLFSAVRQSCDVYFYQLGSKISIEHLYDYSRQAGFYKRSGIDIPNEAVGFMPDKNWVAEKYGDDYYPGGMRANLAIGQGEILVTPLQLARFYGGIANRGIMQTPHFVKKILSPTKEWSREPVWGPATKLGVTNLKTLDVLDQACYMVVNSPGGTGSLARIPGIDVCGKTGTSQNAHGEDHALFVGYAPRSYPKIVIAVVVENGGNGSSTAAPIVRDGILSYLKPELAAQDESTPTPEPITPEIILEPISPPDSTQDSTQDSLLQNNGILEREIQTND